MFKRSRRLGAFTIIELLIVVAIIALLLAILLPSMSAARAQARQLKCNTNLRSLGAAALLYAKENRETLLRAEHVANQLADADPNSTLHWSQALLYSLPYHDGPIPGLWRPTPLTLQQPLIRVLKSIELFQCPSFPESEGAFGDQPLDYITNAFPIPYTLNNVNQDTPNGGGPGVEYRSENQDVVDSAKFFKLDRLDERIISPSRLIYITEVHHRMPVVDLQLHDAFFASQLPFGQYSRMVSDKRHSKGLNALFLDGSAHTMPLRQIDVGNTGTAGTLGLRLRWFTAYLNAPSD